MCSKKTTKILGIITIVYASITIIVLSAILTLLIFIITKSNIKYLSGFSFSAYYTQLLIFSLYLITNILWIISGIALIKSKNWAKNLVIITSILSVFQFPFGTVVGLICFSFMISKDVKQYYLHKIIHKK